MNKLLKRLFASIIAITMITLTGFGGNALPCTVMAAEDSYAGKLVVVHTNDIHGHFDTVEGKQLGLAAVAQIKKDYEAKGANVLLLDAGDYAQGTTLVSYYKGTSASILMNATGYDAATLGNHEFDFGFERTLRIAEEAKFPILDANILSKKTGKPLFESHTVFDYGPMKVGVFGLDTPEAQTKASPKNVKMITILDGHDLYDCAQKEIDALKAEGCNYIICLGHLGTDAESAGRKSIDVVAHTKGIDLFIDGHSHTVMKHGLKVNDTLIASTGTGLENVGVVVYDGQATSASLINAENYDGKYDETINAFVEAHKAIVKKAYDGLFAKSLVDLNGEKSPGVRTEETNLGDFAADAYRFAAQEYIGNAVTIDGAIQNGGGVRASVPAGDITMNDLYTVFPFGNAVAIVKVTGAELLEALEASCSAVPDALGGFPQVSGIEFTINTAVPFVEGEKYPNSTYYAPAMPGARVSIQKVGDRDFAMDDTYYLATNMFVAEGGDTYYAFTKAEEVIDTGILDAEALISYVNSLGGVIGTEYAQPKGRITIK